jgi:ABC-type glycerol-3-phosphate transport system substrate-binding protein
MNKELDRTYSRRDFLKITTALAAAGLTTSLTPDLLYGEAGTDLKGVTIDYWNMIGVQNPVVKQLSESIIKAFEQRTGAKVNTTWDTYGSIIGPKYRTNFLAGKIPTVFDAISSWTGQLRSFLRPLNDFVGEWDSETKEPVSWLFPLIKVQNRGFPDADQIYDLPFLVIPQAPVVTRLDHWKKAGLDFEKNWPIRDTDHFLELLKVFKDQKVSEYPYEVYGKIWDAGDTQLNGWVRSLDIEKSDFLNADWTRSNCDSEPWIRGVQFYVDLFRKYHYSSPDSPQSTDEDAVEQLIRGQKSIVHADILNRGTFLKRIPKEVEAGLIQWGPHFPMAGGTTGSVVFQAMASFSITKQTGPDAEIKERAAWEFIKEWFRAENQIALAKSSGLSARRDVWDGLKGAPDHYIEAVTSMLNNPGVWSNHPKSVDIQYNLFAPHIQQAMGGADVATELKAYAEEVNKILKT